VEEIRQQYPAVPRGTPGQTHNYSENYVQEDEDEEIQPQPRKLPRRPTKAIPGSKQKVEVMRERATRGECLFHPRDAVRDDAAIPEGADHVPESEREPRRGRYTEGDYIGFVLGVADG
jgi:hypothetical protein